MRPILAASPALLLAGALLAAPASAQTMLMPYETQPIAVPQGVPAPSEGNPGQSALTRTAGGTLPQGPYLTECKDARMLQNTLTAFCPRGDGTWQTTQLMQADRCTSGVQNAGGDLVCGMLPQVGSTTPPESYGSSYGGTYPPAYAPVPGQPYAAPAYNGYGPYGPYSATQDQYYAPSASKTAHPYGY